jgi:hypothetical protein
MEYPEWRADFLMEEGEPLNSVHPEIGKFVRDQGARKIVPQA